jgi:hypothetical protein
MSEDARLAFPATERNREPILERLMPLLTGIGRLLEIASGSGEHMAHFAARHPDVEFQPSDVEAAHRASVDAWTAHLGLRNVRPALDLDVTREGWWDTLPAPDLIYCANMIHIAPWAACEGLLRGAGALLEPGHALVLYGPFIQPGVRTADSNLAFDESLKRRDPAWGLRRLDDVDAEAARHGLAREATHAMPANNRLVVYRRAAHRGVAR